MKDSDKKPKENQYNSDITEHNKDILNQNHTHGDGGDDQQLRNRKQKIDFSGKDLNVPGTGSHSLKDEENELFSQGGAENEDLEQDQLI